MRAPVAFAKSKQNCQETLSGISQMRNPFANAKAPFTKIVINRSLARNVKGERSSDHIFTCKNSRIEKEVEKESGNLF